LFHHFIQHLKTLDTNLHLEVMWEGNTVFRPSLLMPDHVMMTPRSGMSPNAFNVLVSGNKRMFVSRPRTIFTISPIPLEEFLELLDDCYLDPFS
jgi:hypothetical protein